MVKKKQRAPSIAEARVYRELKSAITAGQFRAGTVLVQEDLCRQFRASRTPVRDALTHLQAEGLVVAMRNKGVIVRNFSPKDVHDIYEIRALLESAAAKEAAGRIARADLEAIIARATVLNAKKQFAFDQVKELGTALHRLIIEAAGNAQSHGHLDRSVAYSLPPSARPASGNQSRACRDRASALERRRRVGRRADESAFHSDQRGASQDLARRRLQRAPDD
jgi:DNA-binding GntR family transcriptional regulator